MADSPDANDAGDNDMREEYDFQSLQGVVRGKYAARYAERLRVVRLDLRTARRHNRLPFRACPPHCYPSADG